MVYLSVAGNHRLDTELLRALARPIQKNEISKPRLANKPSKLLTAELTRLLNESKRSAKPASLPLVDYKPIDVKFSPSSPEHLMLSDDLKMACLHPFCSGCFHTQAVMLDITLKSNRLVFWSFEIEKGATSGTSVMFGIGDSTRCELNRDGYVQLLGQDAFSWALSSKGHLWHDGKETRDYCEAFDEGRVTRRLACLYNGYTGELSFFIDNVCKGVAFKHIPKSSHLRPVVASTVAKSFYRVEFACESFPSLKQLCRSEIQRNERLLEQAIVDYKLPKSIIDFL